ncbi:rhomboid family intramembrane serine protease [Lentilactobacillus laojiaonis]|uniref:rhomboid family intramembrane serine protease n=1 Tax=Lentilactobacillus laojiaonis TaxID=2883998 RepID=UPI001D09DFA8|nr:rhomboid family intramembrane serine protease [Lentilactobacillus laojiaonis]UDM32617.1 rhomboid family intramembrane serine protease [Lentilactobacillus laojiaonis]
MNFRNLKYKPFMTYALIIIMVLIFIIMSLDGGTTNSYNLVRFGAQFNPYIMAGEYWRLVTPMFLHIGFTHLFLNLFTIYLIGPYVEKIFGHLRFIIIFLLSGIVGNLASFAFSDSVSAGASTAIFGLFGVFIMLSENFQNSIINNMARNFGLLIILNLVSDLFMPQVNIVGHIGGLIGGILASYIVGLPNNKISTAKKVIALILLILISIILFKIGMQF